MSATAITSHCTFSLLDDASDSNIIFIFNISASEKEKRGSLNLRKALKFGFNSAGLWHQVDQTQK